ncbi:MAG TPA: hypothetical protein DEA22_08960 [Blastocatellia bacterium]|nr:hypothetical protein [Blastocatellia bacterium]
MKLKLLFQLTLLFLSGSVVSLYAQDFASIRQKAEDIVASKRLNWKLSHKREEDKQAVYVWGKKREGIGIVIFYGSSQQEAAEHMRFKNNILSVGPGKKRKNYGDEAYSWESNRGNFAGIRFRKANVYIEVTAPSLALAEDIARSLAKEIRKK